MILEGIKTADEFSGKIFEPIDRLLEGLDAPDWLIDAFIDSIHLLPALFIIFLIIELIEFFFSEKINNLIKRLESASIIAGSLAAAVPQCGMPVIASAVYLKRYITKGALAAVYLASSDEAIPVLLAEPDAAHYIIPIIGLKIIIAVTAGYLIDFILKDKKYIFQKTECHHQECEEEEGCCSHSVSGRRKRELIYHPLKHTLSVFVFILIITVILNYVFSIHNPSSVFGRMGIFEPVLTAFTGLIPNCAVSIALTLMLIKGVLSFGAAMSGLLSNAGLGILVLLRHKENIKDTMLIIAILLIVSIISGLIINLGNYISF